MSSPHALLIEPFDGPLDVVVDLPGSKSITNRALVCAALARGRSVLTNALHAEDTEAMVAGLAAMGVAIGADWPAGRVEVEGCAGRPVADLALVDARQSGTTSRFLLPVAGLGEGLRRVDGANRLRERPMGEVLDALRVLGASVHEVGALGHLPAELVGGSLEGGEVTVHGDVSSQFLSGLLLAAPAMPAGLVARLSGELVSRPYVELTEAVMRHFGVEVRRPDERTWAVPAQAYAAAELAVEPDASAASYAFALAVLVDGQVTVRGLGAGAQQGDLAFVDVLAQMGAAVERGPSATTVRGTGTLHGVEVDLSQISDTAQTLAVVAAFAEGPTRVTGIGFIRGKETDRIAAVVAELQRLGAEAVEEPDGFVVHPRPLHGATVRTYDDHRMAMSFALAGARVPGVRIADPDCVAKTFPGYWRLLDELRRPTGGSTMVHRS